MIKAIFFTRFHERKGSRVLHQVPDGAIVPSSSPSALPAPLFNFKDVAQYIIPRQEFRDRLVTVCDNKYRIMGYPVCITDPKYERNEYIFNFVIVLDEDTEFAGHTAIVRKLGRLLRSLEEQGNFLSREEDADIWDKLDATIEEPSGHERAKSPFGDYPPFGNESKVYALCEMILEDLNNYCECMIPIDDSNTINLKLFPKYPPPPPVHAWHVPISTVQLQSLAVSDDLTLNRVIPYINGVRSVAKIADLADVDIHLARKAISHLLYYNCIVLTDIFQFNAIYAQTPAIYNFITGPEMQAECLRYVAKAEAEAKGKAPASVVGSYKKDYKPTLRAKYADDEFDLTKFKPVPEVTEMNLIDLYTSLQHGLSVQNWCIQHADALDGIDVRRLITFGVLKGFLYRVHKYAIAMKEVPHDEDGLGKYLDGMHSFDEICTDLGISSRELEAKLKEYGDVQVIHR
ncbi:nitrogen permease regulator 2 [Patellaria atrata CBS 101060]|uniref:Nitrogen permease regulator 2 n=1 Tax=Patellaria atrata CBS 101060 TaxID=1346257 RepID=A0A9P4SB16_9PEZI|nr:nitrogen permease regulator 2 [Patellaria atrata CBS 101060]